MLTTLVDDIEILMYLGEHVYQRSQLPYFIAIITGSCSPRNLQNSLSMEIRVALA